MKKLLCFQTMITPVLVQILFWIGVIAVIVLGVISMVRHHDFYHGLQFLIIGPIVLRVFAELILLSFRIYDRLGEIADKN